MHNNRFIHTHLLSLYTSVGMDCTRRREGLLAETIFHLFDSGKLQTWPVWSSCQLQGWLPACLSQCIDFTMQRSNLSHLTMQWSNLSHLKTQHLPTTIHKTDTTQWFPHTHRQIPWNNATTHKQPARHLCCTANEATYRPASQWPQLSPHRQTEGTMTPWRDGIIFTQPALQLSPQDL